jgi:hypothetical protein
MGISSAPVLMKSKERVQKHGEVFTPQWVVDKMIGIPGIKEKALDIFATFLEPSAGEGAFLLAIENLKLQTVTKQYNAVWKPNALWALSSIYGIEFLEDNLTLARGNMLKLFLDHYKDVHKRELSPQTNLYKSAQTIIWANIVQGNTLTHKNSKNKEITFSHWEPLPGAIRKSTGPAASAVSRTVQRTPFTYSSIFPETDPSGGTEQQFELFPIRGQLDLFNNIYEPAQGKPKQQKYRACDIEHVWKEEYL